MPPVVGFSPFANGAEFFGGESLCSHQRTSSHGDGSSSRFLYSTDCFSG